MTYRIVCWLIILFACFYGLGSYPLLDHNEGMYAAIARDMLKSGDFIIPRLNGVPYVEKPPLLYWLTAAAMALFGENEWAARFAPALALFATAWKLHRFLLRTTRSETASLTAPLILVTSLPMLAIGRMVLCDMVMTCFLSIALIFFYEWYSESPLPLREGVRGRGSLLNEALPPTPTLPLKGGGSFLYGFYVCLALAAMTKGLVALILAGGTIAVFLLWQRRPWRDRLKALSPAGIFLFLCILVPWHVAASIKDPGFAYFYFINEHVLRFLNMRQPHDYYTGHFWYYFIRIPAYLIPWALFLLLLPPPLRGRVGEGGSSALPHPLTLNGIKNDIRMSFFNHSALKGRGNIHAFLWSWFLFCLFFFSVSAAKANYYMIAGMPPLVMLLALRVEKTMVADARFIRGLTSIALILIVSTVELVKYFCHDGVGDIYPICEVVSWRVIGITGLYALLAVVLCYRLQPRWTVPLLGANVLLLLPVLISGANMAGERVSQKPVAQFLKTSGGNTAIYQEFEELSALAFYLDKPIVIVGSLSSDLSYGQQQLPDGNPYFITLSDWMKRSSELPLIVLNKRIGSVMKQVQAMHGTACVKQQFERVSVMGGCN